MFHVCVRGVAHRPHHLPGHPHPKESLSLPSFVIVAPRSVLEVVIKHPFDLKKDHPRSVLVLTRGFVQSHFYFEIETSDWTCNPQAAQWDGSIFENAACRSASRGF